MMFNTVLGGNEKCVFYFYFKPKQLFDQCNTKHQNQDSGSHGFCSRDGISNAPLSCTSTGAQNAVTIFIDCDNIHKAPSVEPDWESRCLPCSPSLLLGTIKPSVTHVYSPF